MFLNVEKSVPISYITGITLEQKPTERITVNHISVDPHIAIDEQMEYYSNSVRPSSVNSHEVARVNLAMDDFVVSGVSGSSQKIRDFIIGNIAVYLFQIYDKAVVDVAERNFSAFYVAVNSLFGQSSDVPNDFISENYVDIRLVSDAILAGKCVVEKKSPADFNLFTFENPVQESGVIRSERYGLVQEFQFPKESGFLHYMTYADVDLFRLLGSGLDFGSVQGMLNNFVKPSYYTVVADGGLVAKQDGFDVVDLRTFDEFYNAALIHLSDFERAYSGVKDGSYPSVLDPREARPISYFDDIIISRDLKDNAGIVFGIDMLKIAEEESIYSRLLKDGIEDRMLQELLRYMKIEQVKVLRRRVKPQMSINKVGNKYLSIDVWQAEEGALSPQHIVESGDTSGILSANQEERGSIKEIQIVNGLDNGRIRYFSVKDLDVGSITDGFYQYGVFLKVEDGMKNLLKSIYLTFKRERVIFDDYREGIFAKGRYNLGLDRVEPVYADELESGSVRPWDSIVLALELVLKFLNRNVANLVDFGVLNYWISPFNLNSRSLSMFVELLNLIETKLINLLSVSSSTFGFSESRKENKSLDRNIRVEHWFTNQIVDSNEKSGKGAEVIVPDRDSGLPEISIDDFVNHMASVFDKTDNIFGENVGDFFTPDKVFLGENEFDLNGDTFSDILTSTFGSNFESRLQGGVMPVGADTNE